ncbi:MAG: tetratricopeptide repeat protein [Terriglobia bacterium]
MLDRGDDLLRKHAVVSKWLLVLCTVGAFGGMLGNGFVYDDGRQVLENPFVRNPHLWRRIFTGPVWSFLGGAAETNFYRPLHIFSHFLVWRVAQANPAAFHLYQLIFYVINALLVYRLGRDLLKKYLAAFAGALLWALHPLHVEPVCWIAGVPDCGCGLFYLLAFLIFLRGEKSPARRWAWHALGALVYFLALLFKEMGISMPLLLAVYWLVMADAESWWRKGLRGLPYMTAAAAYIGLRITFLGHVSHAPHLWKISPRVAAAALGLLGQHTKLFFWPTDLNDFRNFDFAASLRSPWPWITLLGLGLAILLRKRNPALCFLTLWWPVTLIPCLDVRQLSYPLLAERFSYLPSMGFSVAVAYLALHTLPERFPDRRPARVLVPAFGLALVIFSVLDLRAVPRWRDNDTLWNYSYQVAPQTALVHVHRALDLQYRSSNLAGAAQEYETAIQLNQASFQNLTSVTYDCLIGLGQIASIQGRSDEAVAYFQKAIDLTPRYSAAYDVLGSVYFPRGDYARAATYFQQAVRANPLDMAARFFLGTCWMKMGKPGEAAEQFHAAREVDPGYFQAYEAEARALEAAGDAAGAARVRREKPSQ